MVRPFADHRAAALALLTTSDLSEREGQFCGGLAYRHEPLSEKQLNWLRILLLRHTLPELAQSRRVGQ
jgi:hypothetical protein